MTTLSIETTNRTGNWWHNLWVIAKKEMRDAFRSRLFIIALVMLLGLSLTAIGLGAITVRARVVEYEQSVQVLRDLGRTDIPAMPSLNPLAVSKNFINYLAMIGALLAMILGFTAIDKERKAGTLRLILSRPVYRDQLLTGKIIGNAILLAVFLGVVGVLTIIALYLLGGVGLTGQEIIKLMLTMLMSWLYTLVFFLLSLFFTILVANSNQALTLTIIVWLIFAFIFPQIGDTMDLDNQLPGGFFARMGLNEQEALQQFKWYETVRDGIEQLSPTKHYERISFALLGVKPQFIDNTWDEILQLKLIDIVGMALPIIVLASGSYVLFLRQEQP
ncbi:MAG: ABC transporter permease [Anaerolineae bacterium]|nr:ABC transporter permease [Anaerolineae bacterium]